MESRKNKMKIGFAGFQHGHIFVLYEMAKNHELYEIVAACEEDEKAREEAKWPYQKALLPVASALLVIVIALIMFAIMKLFS